METKVVSKPIEVPTSHYCLQKSTLDNKLGYFCQYFHDDEYPICLQDLGYIKYDEDGNVKKCDACLNLDLIKTKINIIYK